MATTDSDFEERAKKRFKELECHVLKLSSNPIAFMGGEPTGGARFTPQNPFDLIVQRKITREEILGAVVPGLGWGNGKLEELCNSELLNPKKLVAVQTYAIECKTCKDKVFTLNRAKAHQREGLKKFFGVAGFLIEFRGVHRCFFITSNTLDSYDRKKSINVSEMPDLCEVELPRNTRKRERKDYYDMQPMLDLRWTP